MEGPAARAHKPLSAHPPMAGPVTDTEALNWKHDDVKEGRVIRGKGMERFRGEKMKEMKKRKVEGKRD